MLVLGYVVVCFSIAGVKHTGHALERKGLISSYTYSPLSREVRVTLSEGTDAEALESAVYWLLWVCTVCSLRTPQVDTALRPSHINIAERLLLKLARKLIGWGPFDGSFFLNDSSVHQVDTKPHRSSFS